MASIIKRLKYRVPNQVGSFYDNSEICFDISQIKKTGSVTLHKSPMGGSFYEEYNESQKLLL